MFKTNSETGKRIEELLQRIEDLSKKNDYLEKEKEELTSRLEFYSNFQEESFQEAREMQEKYGKLVQENERLKEDRTDIPQKKIEYVNYPPIMDKEIHDKAVVEIFKKLYETLPLSYQTYSMLSLILKDAAEQINYFRISL